MTEGDLGFRFRAQKNGEVVIRHDGRVATRLRHTAAAEFLDDMAGLGETSDDAQQIMARLTGNYRRGNERTAKDHPRNR